MSRDLGDMQFTIQMIITNAKNSYYFGTSSCQFKDE